MTYQSTTTAIDRSLVNSGARLTANIQRLYSLFIWDLEENSILTVDQNELDPANRTKFAEYFFEVPPKVHEVSEPFTTKVIATQNGGKFIESHGSIFKEIKLQGTTGLRPRSANNLSNQIPLFSTNSFENVVEGLNPAQIRQIPESEATGFDDIHFLRNLFRKYSDLKARGAKVVMVWRNIKDDDYWIVEPKDFRLSQDSKSPLTYKYSMNLQGITKFDAALATPSPADPQFSARDVTRFYSRVREYQQNLTNSLMVISTQINRIKGAGYNTVDVLVRPIAGTIRGLAAIGNAAAGLPTALLQAATSGVNEINSALEVLEESLEPLDDNNILETRDELINSLRRARATLYRVMGEKEIRDSLSAQAVERTQRMSSAYSQPGVGLVPYSKLQLRPGVSFLSGTSSVSNVATSRVGRGESIRDLATRTLGDGSRWHEIVILNDLKSPYTTDSTNPPSGVLGIGDTFYYPVSRDALDPSIISPQNVTDLETDREGNPILGDLAAQAYGRDIRLKTSYSGTTELIDFEVNQNGDISTIVGMPNVEQAIKIKFSTERGELPAHPRFGAKYPIGTKADIASFNTFRIDTLATLESDPRISRVKRLEFRAYQDILTLSADLTLQNNVDILSTNFALRRF